MEKKMNITMKQIQDEDMSAVTGGRIVPASRPVGGPRENEPQEQESNALRDTIGRIVPDDRAGIIGRIVPRKD